MTNGTLKEMAKASPGIVGMVLVVWIFSGMTSEANQEVKQLFEQASRDHSECHVITERIQDKMVAALDSLATASAGNTREVELLRMTMEKLIERLP